MLRNISAEGVALRAPEAPDGFDVGSRVQLTMELPFPRKRWHVEGDVVWCSDHGLGVHFVSPSQEFHDALRAFLKSYLFLASPDDVRKHIDDLLDESKS
jgi:hypothetical protein